MELIVPEWLTALPRVTIARGKDWGPATKLIPALVDVATHPEDVIITFDDDNYYYPDVAANLLKYSLQHPTSIISHNAYNLKGSPPRHPNFDYKPRVCMCTAAVDNNAGFRYK